MYDILDQTQKFTGMTIAIAAGTAKKRCDMYHELEKRDDISMVVVSYETFRTDIDNFNLMHDRKPFDMVFLDEAHKAKNGNVGIGKAIFHMDVPQKYAITATPVVNELLDMQNILYWMGVLPYTYWGFKNKFCNLDGWGNVASYKNNVGEVKSILQSNMLRRLKQDVLSDLPPVINNNIIVELTTAQRKLYKQVEEAPEGSIEFDDLFFEDIPTHLARFGRLGQIAESCEIVGGPGGTKGSAKLKALEELIEEIVARGEKAVVFSRSKLFVDVIVEHFKKYNPAVRHGEMPAKEIHANVGKLIDNPDCKLIICTEQSSREGWTAVSGNTLDSHGNVIKAGNACVNVIFTSKPWSPAYTSQCIGRVWRYGAQDYQNINVYSLIAKDTIDEKIEKLLSEKQYTIDAVVETPLSTKEILKILE